MRIKLVQMNVEKKELRDSFKIMQQYLDSESDLIIFPLGSIGGICSLFESNSNTFLKDCYNLSVEFAKFAVEKTIIWGSLDHDGNIAAYVAFNGQIQTIIPLFNNNINLSVVNNVMYNFTCNDCDFVLSNQYHDCDDKTLILMDLSIYRHDNLVTSKGGIYSNPVGIIDDGHHIAYLCGGSKLKNISFPYLIEACYDNYDSIEYEVTTPSLLKALLMIIKAIDKKYFSFADKWIVGLSGGLDSSVVASLLTLALGNQRILGLNMASTYNSLTTKNNANQLANALGIEIRNESIMDLVDATQTTLSKYNFEPAQGLALENIQARLRGHLLMTVSSLVNGVVSNNTNKIEAFLGYGTMYGDTIGAMGFLGDLTKQEVWDLAKEINVYMKKEIVPSCLLPNDTEKGLEWQFMPSAELKDGQIDPMKWGYHDYLIEKLMSDFDYLYIFMSEYLNNKLQNSKIAKYVEYYGLLDSQEFIKDLEWILTSMNRNQFKRVASCPVLLCGRSGSFGINHVDTLSKYVYSYKYKELKEAILKC